MRKLRTEYFDIILLMRVLKCILTRTIYSQINELIFLRKICVHNNF